MCRSSIFSDSLDINFERCGTIIVAPKKNIYAFVCNLCNDVYEFMPQFIRHLLQEHDEDFMFNYDAVQETYALEELLNGLDVDAYNEEELYDDKEFDSFLENEEMLNSSKDIVSMDMLDLKTSTNMPGTLSENSGFKVNCNIKELNGESKFQIVAANTESNEQKEKNGPNNSNVNSNSIVSSSNSLKNIKVPPGVTLNFVNKAGSKKNTPEKTINQSNRKNSSILNKQMDLINVEKENIKCLDDGNISITSSTEIKETITKSLNIQMNTSIGKSMKNDNKPTEVNKVLEKIPLLGKQICIKKIFKKSTEEIIEEEKVQEICEFLQDKKSESSINKRKLNHSPEETPIKKMKTQLDSSNPDRPEIESTENEKQTLEDCIIDSDGLDIINEIISQVSDAASYDSQNSSSEKYSDMELMSKIGLAPILNPNVPYELNENDKSRATKVAGVIESENYIWSTKFFKTPAQTESTFNRLTSLLNQEFSLDFSQKDLKRIWNLITIWHAHQNHEKFHSTRNGNLKFFERLFAFLPKSGRKTFFCEYCTESFYSETKYLQHSIIHTGKLPYVCKHCGRSFKVKSSLLRHEGNHKIHSSDSYK